EPVDSLGLLGVLGRIAVRLGLPVPAEAADSAAAAMTEVLARCAQGRTLDLYDEPLAGGVTA
ncbi:hypothetical protein R6V09_40210, partial [Streptomyces sp. W16]|uniref:hypothetical protein n=1 Tax=Streptomyces sp. W16 TaxID=3076631 RepID=UPI00295B1543